MKLSSQMVAGVVAATFLTAAPMTSAKAQADTAMPGEQFATRLAASLVSHLLNRVFGEELSSIFGSEGGGGITPEELAAAIDNGFNEAAKKSISVDVDALGRSIRVYVPETPYASTNSTLRAWRDDSGKIQADIHAHMSKANFMDLVPSYITATTTRLAVMSEIRRQELANFKEGEDPSEFDRKSAEAMAGEAENALHELSNFFLEDFADPKLNASTIMREGLCMAKPKGLKYWHWDWKMPFYDWSSVDGKTTAAFSGGAPTGFARPHDISTTWCPKKEGRHILGKKGQDGPSPFQTAFKIPKDIQDVMIARSPWKIPHTKVWVATYREERVVKFEEFKTLESARFRMAAGSKDSYPSTLGKISELAKAWFDIVVASGTHDQIVESAKHATVFVDVAYLKAKAPAEYSDWYDQTATTLIAGK